ncbi:uncharacterized protein RBU57_000342 isoform 1-T1 [Macrochelys suwanniensis]
MIQISVEKNNTAKYKMPNKFLKHVGDIFLFQKVEEVTGHTAILDAIVTHREELVANLKVTGNLDESDHEMKDLMNLRKGRSEGTRERRKDFKKADFNKPRKLALGILYLRDSGRIHFTEIKETMDNHLRGQWSVSICQHLWI